MAKDKLPYFKWYPKDFDHNEKVRLMNLEEIGLYALCLNHSWVNGSLPADLDEIGRAMKVPPKQLRRAWPRVAPCFVEVEGRLINPRQESERELAISKSEKNSTSSAMRENNKIPGYIYLISRSSDGATKIGSSNSVPRRLAQLKYRYIDERLQLVHSAKVASMGDSEVYLHKLYESKRVSGEWFLLSEKDQGDIRITLGGDKHNHHAPRALGRAESESGSGSSEGGPGVFDCRSVAQQLWDIHPSPSEFGFVEAAVANEMRNSVHSAEVFAAKIVESLRAWVEYWTVQKRYPIGLKKWVESGDYAKVPPYKATGPAPTHYETPEEREERITREDAERRRQ